MDGPRRRLLWLLGLAIYFEGYGRSLIVNTLGYVADDLRVGDAALSNALGWIGVGSLGVLALGPLADRFGRRRLLLASVALLALFGGGTAIATTLPMLVVWQAAARMFQEGALFAAMVIAAEEMPADRRSAMQGILGTVNSVGSGLGALLLAVIEWWPAGWRGLCVVSLIPLLFLPFLRRALPESRRWLARTGHSLRRPPPEYRGRVLAALTVVFLAMSYDIAGFSFVTYLPKTQYGWSPGAVSAMVIVAGGLGLPGWWLGGQFADRCGRRVAAILFCVGLSVAEVAFYLGGPAALWPAFGVMVFCQGGKITVLRSWATELFPTSFRGTAASWLAAAGTLGGMAGLELASVLVRPLGGIAPALALISVAGVLAAIGSWVWLPETRGLELESAAPEVA